MAKKDSNDLDVGITTGLSVVKAEKTTEVKAEEVLLGSNAAAPEDKFGGLYTATGNSQVIQPPYSPSTLHNLTQSNNTLLQCVEAMEVNIDGTGHDIFPTKGGKGKKRTESVLAGFFSEPYPKVSMISIRRRLRRDIEITGNGYLEVIRNATNTIVMLNHVPSVNMRLGRLSAPVPATKTLVRRGNPTSIKVMLRERTFVQLVNAKPVYFREYGASRSMDKTTGVWEKGLVPAKKRATEILHFTAILDGTSPYGIPRWINQVPSVLGSRKAEEHNLDFFNSGGLPPVLITISGGKMVKDTKDALENYLNGKGGSQHRAAILEAYASGTALDSSGSVKITVERFGAEKQNDSMFEGYDAKCEARVRASFRLPELYVGRNSGNFATSRASSMLAEAQVFGPERAEFDELMNLTIMKELAGGDYRYVSKQNLAKDGNLQMKGIAVARSTGAVNPENIVDNISEVAGLELVFDANELAKTETKNKDKALEALAGLNSLDAGKGQDKDKPDDKIKKMDVAELAHSWGDVALDESSLSSQDKLVLKDTVDNLEGAAKEAFMTLIAAHVYPAADDDLEGAGELACVLAEISAYA